VTDTNTAEDLEFFDDAKEEFPAKEDLKDRLVLIFATGKQGTRKSEVDGKPYPWCETVTLVLDDGPDGTAVTDLVPSAAGAPIELSGFQWSTGGMVARIKPRADAKNFRPQLGRINSRKNSRKGFSDSWSISEPTDEDKAIARKHNAKAREIMDRLANPAGGESEDDAFS
jgi:hypothetical protein